MIQPAAHDKRSARGIILLAALLAAIAIVWPMIIGWLAPLPSFTPAVPSAIAWFVIGAVMSALVTWSVVTQRVQPEAAAVAPPNPMPPPPNLTVGFESTSGRVRTVFADGTPAVSIRLKVSNHTGRTVQNCRAFLVGIGRPTETGRVIPSRYSEHLPLTWAASVGVAAVAIDIQNGHSALLDVLCLRQGAAHPTINLDYPDPECDLDYVPNQARPIDARIALCNCIAFGSKNSAIVLRRA